MLKKYHFMKICNLFGITERNVLDLFQKEFYYHCLHEFHKQIRNFQY